MKKAVLVLLSALAACGGGGSSTSPASPTPVPTNAAPVLTSATTISVNENTLGIFYRITTSDADGDPVTVSLASPAGPAGDPILLLSDNTLAFTGPPDFETLVPAGGTSVTYNIDLILSDGKAQSTARVQVNLVNVPDNFTVDKVGTSYPRVNYVAAVPGQKTVFITETSGEIHLVDPSTGTDTLYMTVPGLHPGAATGGLGLLTIAAAPDYATSGNLYAMLITPTGALEIRRYGRLTATTGNPAGQTIMVVPPKSASAATSPENIGGWLGFGPDGLLYLTTSIGTPPSTLGGDLTSLLGKLLRIDVTRDDFPADLTRNYGIPSGNPYVASATNAKEILAYGFRNPNRASFYGVNLIVGDNDPSGPNNTTHRVVIIQPFDGGGNYAPGARAAGIEFGGEVFFGTGILVGGYVFQQPNSPAFGQYVYYGGAGRFFFRNIYRINYDRLVAGPTLVGPQAVGDGSLAASIAGGDPPSSFGEDADHNMYVVERPYVGKMYFR